MDKLPYREFLAMIQERTREADVPYHGSFELTPLCNLDCKMCYVHLQDPSVKHQMLSGEQWISLIQQAIDEGMMEAMLTGGEAMTHPAFWDIYMYLINHGIPTQVKTNGLLLNEEAIKRFLAYRPYRIDISLYGCDSESYVAVTGVDAYEQVVRNIRMAVESGLGIQIMVTPSNYMAPWAERVMQLAQSFGVKVMAPQLLGIAGPACGYARCDARLLEFGPSPLPAHPRHPVHTPAEGGVDVDAPFPALVVGAVSGITVGGQLTQNLAVGVPHQV